MRHLSLSDRLLDELQHGLSTCHLRPPAAERAYPADKTEQPELSQQEQAHVAGLMRINNAGEVAAQGLYRGQALTARKQAISDAMNEAAEEENEHLNWCQRRLGELDQGRSLLDGVWYWGSFTIGAVAGAAGDKWSLGFVKETEQQVCAHLDEHLECLPEQDQRSRAILSTMREDESRHATNAAQAGAAELPSPVKKAMTLVSKIMTFTAYRI
ncbi:MAG: 2-polyprenyl-3-methyl-6-methoxy-1,4-benzoquinone monooxygenase [Gammaproteobacteria bacterium]|nr:2-polyprenyl-3-methyl-6-methoxy-1,4-benzoquinone monooxygenase [Gammaproteobacteria bacterium]